MENNIGKLRTKKKRVAKSGRFFSTNVLMGSDGTITIKLPAEAANYLDFKNTKVFWVPINGVIQISGHEPHMVIPMINVNKNTFVPHATS